MKNFTKRILSSVILITVFSFAVNAQTNVSGGIFSNTTWTLAGSPYIVTNTVVVFPAENFRKGEYVNVLADQCTSATLIGKVIS